MTDEATRASIVVKSKLERLIEDWIEDNRSSLEAGGIGSPSELADALIDSVVSSNEIELFKPIAHRDS
jgi:hypothetical protein